MNLASINALCAALPHATHIVQWSGSDVWKVGGKVFAIARDADNCAAVSFKVTPISFDVLGQMPGLRPAPYMASRGMKWIQYYGAESFDADDLQHYLSESHRLVVEGLTRKVRADFSLNP